ncbi:HU family DNA-binding protein [Hoylesella enoeca]|uniref:DNA-binding protein n=1 Tax=Hoylesella enoeca TaxID=76123 RepID=A0A0S2KKQ4_9BACT|nr:HU family DNA-binding protein [Hoylesella enoeca]ALO48853.1 DNA-binding protein [Hoylesella enoeca]ALO48877.1 DNA-binding protein [Hoylesella enoeca]
MAFWKKILMKINNRWYPKSVLVGGPVSTAQIARRLADESTISPADVMAVLTALAHVMADYMAQGRSVKLDGIGTFYFTAVAAKGGAATEKEVTANMITGVRVRFIPETRFSKNGAGSAAGKRAIRGLSDVEIEWEEWKGEEKKKPAKPKP